MTTEQYPAIGVEGAGHASSTPIVRRCLNAFFPHLPLVGQIGAAFLAVCTIVAVGLAWWANLVHSTGFPVALFLAVVLTGFTIAAAALPHIAYRWLLAHGGSNGIGGDAIGAAVISHAPLGLLSLVNLVRCGDHAPAFVAVALVALVGAILWGIHEGLVYVKATEVKQAGIAAA